MKNNHSLFTVKKQSVTEQAVDILNDYILSGDLKTGEFLPPEKKLCEQLGIGRSTLREAIKILESNGLVRKKHGYGVMVVDESVEAAKGTLKLMLQRTGTTMDELMEVRNLNEIKTTELAAIHASEEDMAEIQSHLRIMRDNMASTEEYVKADIDFHMAIAKASRNKVFHLILLTIRPLIEEMIAQTLKVHHRPERSMKYHEKIFEAINGRNPDAAVHAMKEHLEGTRKMLNKSLKTSKDEHVN